MKHSLTSLGSLVVFIALHAGCGPTRISSGSTGLVAGSDSYECLSDPISELEGVRAHQVLLRPVGVRAAVPGRAIVYADGLRGSVSSALATSSAVVLVSPEVAQVGTKEWVDLAIVITQFRVLTESHKDQNYGQVPMVPVAWRGGTSTQEWLVVAYVEATFGDGTTMSWEATERGDMSRRTTDLEMFPGLGTVARHGSQESSHFNILCRLGHQIAQDLVERICIHSRAHERS